MCGLKGTRHEMNLSGFVRGTADYLARPADHNDNLPQAELVPGQRFPLLGSGSLRVHLGPALQGFLDADWILEEGVAESPLQIGQIDLETDTNHPQMSTKVPIFFSAKLLALGAG